MKNEQGITKQEVITLLCRSPHEAKTPGKREKLSDMQKLSKYIVPAQKAVQSDEEFFAHLIAWNAVHGEIRDTKVAMPLFQLGSDVPEFKSNALAHLAMLDPRNLVRAIRFARGAKLSGRRKLLRKLVIAYLQWLESDMKRWEKKFIQHRVSVKTLYGWARYKASDRAAALLRGEYAAGSTLDLISRLHELPAVDAANAIMERNIPFLVAQGAIGKRKDNVDLLMALIKRMSPAELITNMKFLEKNGVKTVPELRAALDEALAKASTSKRVTTLKTSVAVEAIENEELREQLRGLQERQIDKSKGIEGDWLVLADKSGSMCTAIEGGRQIAAALTRFVKGRVDLVFFNTTPQVIEATGKSYDELLKVTKHVKADGGTSIGCGLQWALDNKRAYQGIAVITDGGENSSPFFAPVYQKYAEKMGVEPTVYLYKVPSYSDVFKRTCTSNGIDVQEYDLTKGNIDYVALPGIVQTMRVNRYSLIDEIMETPLLDFGKILEKKGVSHA
jgi:hypothetical protein